MANKLHSNSRRIIENISWFPTLKDTGDLEAATKTISATAEASGVGNADYSSTQTLSTATVLNGAASTLAACRLAIMRIASRFSVTIDSDDGTHDLRCRVYVDAQDANHLLYDLTYSTTGNQLAVQATLVGTKEIIYNLLKDGSAHTFYFFFWSPGNHSPVISVCELWYGVGSGSTSGAQALSFTMAGQGCLRLGGEATTLGTANYLRYQIPYSASAYQDLTTGAGSGSSVLSYLNAAILTYGGDAVLQVTSQSATDILCIRIMSITLISEG